MQHRTSPSHINHKVMALSGDKDAPGGRIAVFTFVRDLPYDYPASRDPEEALRQGRGSCSGKHALLAEMLGVLGYETKVLYVRHRLNDVMLPYPPHLAQFLDEHELFDIHNFVRARIEGRWISLDVTWDRPLTAFGFPVNMEWDGFSDTTIAAGPFEVIATGTVSEQEKEVLLQDILPPDSYAARREFFVMLAAWLKTLREQGDKRTV